MEPYPLLTKRRLRFFFLEELLLRELNICLLELCPMLNPFNNNHCGKKMEDIALRKMVLERKIQLNIFHLKRLPDSFGRFKYDNDSDGYKMYKREPVPPSEYRLKNGRRAPHPVRLAPHLDHWYAVACKKTKQQILEEMEPGEERNQYLWEWEAKTYCPEYNKFPSMGEMWPYPKVNRTFANGKQRVPHLQSEHFVRMLRTYYPESHWWDFTDEMRKIRARITPACLKRRRKTIRRKAEKERFKKMILSMSIPI